MVNLDGAFILMHTIVTPEEIEQYFIIVFDSIFFFYLFGDYYTVLYFWKTITNPNIGTPRTHSAAVLHFAGQSAERQSTSVVSEEFAN